LSRQRVQPHLNCCSTASHDSTRVWVLSFLEPQSSFSKNRFSRLPKCAPRTSLLFNVEVNLCCGAVLGDLLAVQFHL
jgi:hypothetical protein